MTEIPEAEDPPLSFFDELKRRHVVRVGLAYAALAWLLLQLGSIVLPTFGAPGWVMKVLIGLLVLFFPIALLLAWAFEMTPEGVRRTEPARSPEPRPAAQGRRVGGTLSAVTIVVLAAAVAVLGWRVLARPGSAKKDAIGQAGAKGAPPSGDSLTSGPSIAVLPLQNASGDPNNRYFSDGLSEGLIDALSQLPRLKVIGRQSSFQFRDTDLGSRAIGRKLGVAHLLEGSVSRAGDEVRLRAELVSTSDGATQWSRTYDRPYRNLFALQDDLTSAVAQALKARLLNDARGSPIRTDRPPSGSVDAYNAFLEGRYFAKRFTRADFRRAIQEYRKAVELDPRYAAAFVGLSSTWGNLGGAFLGGAELRRAYDSAGAAVDSALALDPDLPAAHLSRGFLLLQDSMDWRGAEAADRRALELAPDDPRAERALAVSLASLGHLEEAVRLSRQALASDPLNAGYFYALGKYLLGLGRTGEAVGALRHAVELTPDGAALHAWLAEAEIVRGDTTRALRAARQETDPAWKRWAVAMATAAAGDTARATAALRRFIANDADFAAYQIADVYALRQEPDSAFTWLERAWKQHDPGIAGLLFDPFLLRYQNDPRFAAFCRKVGLPIPGRAMAAARASGSSS